jgi:DNA polymerase III subunit epsilon
VTELSNYSFVAVDCETTGIHPGSHHRIVELAVIPFDPRNGPGETWSSLLNPDRDLGPTGVHGIRGRDLVDAPRFDELLGDIIERLAGNVVVAHNARFDVAFLEAELKRCGIEPPTIASICTMRMAGLLGSGGVRAKLRDCCAAEGIEVRREHSAADDAMACASLFCSYFPALVRTGRSALVAPAPCDPGPSSAWPSRTNQSEPRPRDQRSQRPAEQPAFLAKLASQVRAEDDASVVDAGAVAPYLDVLDRALEDRLLNEIEQSELEATASMLGLSAERVRTAHADYVSTLVAVALRDGVVTDRERADLELVAETLGVSGIHDVLAMTVGNSHRVASDNGSIAGQTVCFTGELLCILQGSQLTREMAEELASAAGMLPKPRVTKTLDMLVVADPNTMSGKAKKAREYGIRIIAETAFWAMIGIEVD